ncbi:MAG: prephenate dehydrogenase/arogenate dehydrogenase family protein [Gammaproteobacteria bacterium]|nr:prephenate dehydrogenase/arogenate dehydrogenase family protein [Gammaproteobacteria bacterium]MBI5614813.1 prephenate dehydrogenase/arogenate dehydrogenase family protein [Gammaproteobacteria bacterium]
MGGSLARALRRAGAVGEIVGCARNTADLGTAVELGVIDRWTTDPAEAVAGADVVMVAVTLGATEQILAKAAPALEPDAVVTDVGSTKGSVVAAARRVLGPAIARFVGGHPIAGSERTGVEASFADLYVNHRVILTPLPENDLQAVAKVRAMWESCGAIVTEMDVAHHDEVLAATSHLPHMLAYALVDALVGMSTSGEIFDYAAGGFRDTTRIAASSPEMWRDIALANAPAVLAMCDRFEATFGAVRAAIAAGDGEALRTIFARAKAARERLPLRGPSR